MPSQLFRPPGGSYRRAYKPRTNFQRYRTAYSAGVVPAIAYAAKRMYSYPKRSAYRKRSGNLRGSYTARRKPTLKKQVKEIKKDMKGTTSVLIVRRRDTFSQTVPTNQSSHQHYNVNYIPHMEDAISEVPYFDVGTGSLITKNLTDDTFQRGIIFKTIYADIRLSNNYKVPVNVRIYVVCPKIDTDVNPDFAITNGIVDQMDTVSSLSTQLFPTDVTQFNDLWSIKKTIKKRLQPGSQVTLSHSVKDVSYDTSFVDDNSDVYQKTNKNFTFLVRLEGPIGHQSDNILNVGSTNAGVDVIVDSKYVLHYDGGLQGAQRYRFIDNSDAVDNGVVCNKPAAVNATYSAVPGL